LTHVWISFDSYPLKQMHVLFFSVECNPH
jgi:hypothetical protein